MVMLDPDPFARNAHFVMNVSRGAAAFLNNKRFAAVMFPNQL